MCCPADSTGITMTNKTKRQVKTRDKSKQEAHWDTAVCKKLHQSVCIYACTKHTLHFQYYLQFGILDVASLQNKVPFV